GLFAATQLNPKEHVIDYVGYVQLSQHSSQTSDYVLRFEDGLAIDAEKMGNEARFVNDYRGTNLKPNVQFENRIDEVTGEVNIGVWVLGAPIKKGTELLVSYGKGFWQARQQVQNFE